MVFDPTDLFTCILTNPQYAFIVILWGGGYYFFRLFYRGSAHWRRLNSTERWILGGLLGGWIGFTGIPFLDVAFYAVVHMHLDGLTLAFASSLIFGFTALTFWVHGVLGTSAEQSLHKFLSYCILISLVSLSAMVAISIIKSEVQYYPSSTLDIIRDYWNGFGQGELLLTMASPVVVYLLLVKPRLIDQAQNIRTLRFPGSKPRTPTVSKSIRAIWNTSVFRYCLASLLVVVAVSCLIVPIDLQTNAFTPRVHSGPESFYAQQGCNDDYSDLLLIRTDYGVYNFYQEMQMPYSVTLPWLYRFDTVVSVVNPSNFSIYARAFMPYGDIWAYVTANGPANVSFSYIPVDGRLVTIRADLTAVTNSSTKFTLLYYNEFLRRAILYSEPDNSSFEIGNTTVLSHSFVITNHEKICVYIPRIGFAQLNEEGVNVTLAKIYVNGRLQPTRADQRGFYPGIVVYPDQTVNITLTYPVAQP